MLNDDPKMNRRKRRWMVVGYYAATIGLGVISIYLMRWRFVRPTGLGAFFPLLMSVAGILGGLRPGGPVRPFSARLACTVYSGTLTELSLGSRRHGFGETPLDERDIAVRDHAHYIAMSVLRIVIVLLALSVWFAITHFAAWLPTIASLGCYLLVIMAMSLPQAILLWAEPDSAPESSFYQATGERMR